jgi:hypothetical protein
MPWWPEVLFTLLACYGAWVGAGRLLRRIARTFGVRARPSFISVALLVRDQAPVIEDLVASLLRVQESLPADGPQYEVVVVDDGSADETPRILERLALRHPHLRTGRVDGHGRGADSAFAAAAELCRFRGILLFQVTAAAGATAPVVETVRRLFGAGGDADAPDLAGSRRASPAS